MPRAPTIPSTRKPLGYRLYYTSTYIHAHTHLQSFKLGHAHERRGTRTLRRAIRAGVTRGELGGEPQSSSSSLEATSDGTAELSEGGEGGHASSSSGQEPSEVARD